MYEIEQSLFDNGIEYIAGVDEAGRGPLAGPVCAAAVILKKGQFIDGVKDSKKLSEKKREELYDVIINNAEAYAIVLCDEKEIDEINILNATFKAMNEAIKQLKIKTDYILIDGNSIKNLDIPHECVVKGDAKCNSIGAASILAKVTRDRYMMEMHEKYPEYGFDKHKGYPTKLHYEMIEKHGILPIHRLTYLKKILNNGDN